MAGIFAVHLFCRCIYFADVFTCSTCYKIAAEHQLFGNFSSYMIGLLYYTMMGCLAKCIISKSI